MTHSDPSTPAFGARILVTGGAGFIGHRVVTNLLADAGTEVGIVDNLSVGMPMPPQRPRLALFETDIRDQDELAKIFSAFRPDTVIHLAAVHHIPTCEKKRSYALDVNVVGTENLLDLCEKHGVLRFLLASSGAVYDWADGPLDESVTPVRPCDNYAISKYANERQAAFWAERTGASLRVARIFNTIGHDDPNGHLVPDIIAQIPVGAREATIALGNLKPRRDYIHADDTARAIAMIAREKGPAAIDTYNVATGADVSVGELVGMLGDVMGVKIHITEDPARKRRVDRPSQLGLTKKLREQVGFTAQKSLRIALQDIVAHSGRSASSA